MRSWGSALLREQGNPDSIRFMHRRFAGPRHDRNYVYAIATEGTLPLPSVGGTTRIER
jgi:hypothetical protein